MEICDHANGGKIDPPISGEHPVVVVAGGERAPGAGHFDQNLCRRVAFTGLPLVGME
jgi:hypothetical protein